MLNKKILVTFFISIVLFGIFVSAGIIEDISDGIGDLIGGKEKTTNDIKQIIYDSSNSEIVETSNGFKKIIYMNPVNIEYNGKFLPIENYINILKNSSEIIISDLDGNICFISLNYTLKNKLDIPKEEINITKNRGGYYFTTNVDKKVDFMGYIINCSKSYYDNTNDDLILNDKIKMDFSEAKEKQNISTTYDETTGKLEFSAISGKTANLEFIDPFVTTYNFNVSNQNIYMFAYNGDECSAPSSPQAYPLTCSGGTISDVTTNGAFDTSDGTKYSVSTTGGFGFLQFDYVTTFNTSDITLLNWTIEGCAPNNVGNISIYNQTANNWTYSANLDADGCTSDTTSYISTSHNISQAHFNGNNASLVVYSGTNGGDFSIDYVGLSINYDDIIINGLSNSQEVLNTLNTTLNVSSSGYNSTIYWTANGGISNTTLCTNCNSPNWTTISFKRQGYYNLSVYANKSDGTIKSKTVTNVFVGNISNFDSNNSNNIYTQFLDSAQCSDSPPPNDGPYPSCSSSFTDVSTNSDFDFLDSSFHQTTVASPQFVFLEIVVNLSNLTDKNFKNLSFSYTGKSSGTGRKINQYIWNNSGSSWLYLSQIGDASSTSLNSTIDTNFINSTGFVHYISQAVSTGTSVYTDYFSLNYTYYLNNTVPVVSLITANGNNYSNGTNIKLQFNTTDDNDWVQRIDLFTSASETQPVQSFLNYPLNTTNATLNFLYNATSGDGTYSWKIGVTDSDGVQINSSSYSFVLDSTPPLITIVYPEDYQPFTSTTVAINYTISETGVGLSSCWATNSSGLFNYSFTCGVNLTVSESGSGTYTGIIYANDTLGNNGSATIHYVISTNAPGVELNHPKNNQWFQNGTNLNFNLTATDSNGLKNASLWGNWTGTWHLNQTNVTAITSGNIFTFMQNITNGFFKFNFQVYDTTNVEGWGGSNFSFGIDTINPNINLTEPRNITYTTTALQINFTANDTNRQSCHYSINSGLTNTTLSNCLNISYTANQGSTQLFVYVNDSANRQNSSNLTFFVDSLNPNITVLSPINATYFNTNLSIRINLSEKDNNIQTCQYSDNGGANTSYTCNANLSLDLSDQVLHTIRFRANDTLNNLNTTTSISFYTDSLNTNINDILITTLPNSQTISFTANITDTFLNSCWYSIRNSTNEIDSSTTENTSISPCSKGVLISESDTVSDYGTYNLTIYADDLAGNENSSTSSFTVSQSTSPGTPGGGGATPASEPKIPVLGINSINGTIEYNNLLREIIYAKMNDYCSEKLRSGEENLAIVDYSSLCVLNNADLIVIKSKVDFYNLAVDLGDLSKFYALYKQNQLFQGYETQETINIYGLTTSVLGITNLFQLTPPSIYSPQAINVRSGNYTIPYDVYSNKPLKSCEVISKTPNLNCEVLNSTLKIYYTIDDVRFISEIFTGTILVTTDSKPETTEQKKLPIAFTVYNIGFEIIPGLTIFMASIVLIILILVFGSIFYIRKKRRKTMNLKEFVRLS